MRRRLIVSAIVPFLLGAACNDPWSQHRIKARMTHLNATLTDIQKREASGVQRIDEAGQTLQKWWRSDSKRFNERIVTVGDYIF